MVDLISVSNVKMLNLEPANHRTSIQDNKSDQMFDFNLLSLRMNISVLIKMIHS